MYFAQNIKYARSKLKFSQAEFAELLERKRSVIGSYESGNSSPSINDILKIAEKLNVTAEVLLFSDMNEQNLPIKTASDDQFSATSIVVTQTSNGNGDNKVKNSGDCGAKDELIASLYRELATKDKLIALLEARGAIT